MINKCLRCEKEMLEDHLYPIECKLFCSAKCYIEYSYEEKSKKAAEEIISKLLSKPE